MNREDIIRMAQEADRYASANHVQWIGPEVINMDWVVARDEHFAALVAAAEREACAYRAGIALLGADRGLANRVDQAIRARGQA